jgi:hypothetical protein
MGAARVCVRTYREQVLSISDQCVECYVVLFYSTIVSRFSRVDEAEEPRRFTSHTLTSTQQFYKWLVHNRLVVDQRVSVSRHNQRGLSNSLCVV